MNIRELRGRQQSLLCGDERVPPSTGTKGQMPLRGKGKIQIVGGGENRVVALGQGGLQGFYPSPDLNRHLPR